MQESAGEGTDTIHSAVNHTLGDNIENLTLTGSGSTIAIGNVLDNLLIGNEGDNQLSGLGGADTLLAGAGNDHGLHVARHLAAPGDLGGGA